MRTPKPAVAAHNGAAFLDTEAPYWYRHISIRRLNQHSSWDCILAQRYGTYTLGLRRLNLNIPAVAARNGFTLPFWQQLILPWRWQLLDRAWAAEIWHRQDADWDEVEAATPSEQLAELNRQLTSWTEKERTGVPA